MTNFPRIISIEGNIGTGKSTLLANLKTQIMNQYPENAGKILFLEEPVDIWERFRDDNGLTILEKFYTNQPRYAFTFQVMAYISRMSLLKNAIKNNPQCETIIIERSLCADKNIFMDMLHDDGIVENIEYNIYKEWYHEFIGEYRMDAVIYLDSTPDICYSRIARRNRQGEGGIPLEYLTKCFNYHQRWLVDTKCADGYSLSADAQVYMVEHENTQFPVLQINTDAETNYDVNSKGSEWINAICMFIMNYTAVISKQLIDAADFKLLIHWRWQQSISKPDLALICERLKTVCPHEECVNDCAEISYEIDMCFKYCVKCYSTWNN